MLSFNDVLIIIIAYNPADNFLANLQIASANYLIIDNSSCANELIASFCAQTTNCVYLPLNENTGIAHALNRGCQYALQRGFNWVVSMDQDSRMTADILQQMLDFANQFSALKHTAIISPRHCYQTQTKNYVPDETREYNEVPYTMTSGNLLNLSVWQQLGGFNADLFIDMVDTDFCCRATLAGYKIIVITHLDMQHVLGNLQRIKLPGKNVYIYHHNYIRKYYQVRNTLWFIKQYRGKAKVWRIFIYLFAMVITTMLFEQDKRRKIRYMWLGWKDFKCGKLGKIDI